MNSPAGLLPLLALATGLRTPVAEPSLAHARLAQHLLGPGRWSRLIQIENHGHPTPYPPVVSAVVFELEGILWFYTDTDGTQSLSRYRGHAAQDETDFGPLLATIDPGFARWWDVASEAKPAKPEFRPGRLPNGCFIESLALLRHRLEAGAPAWDARLLSYYLSVPGGIHGHTVLQFRTPEGWMAIDPHFPKRRFRIDSRSAADPAASAACLRPDVATARWLSLEGEPIGR